MKQRGINGFGEMITNYLNRANGIITSQYCRLKNIPIVYFTMLFKVDIGPIIYAEIIRQQAISKYANINKKFTYAIRMGIFEK